MKTRIYSLIAFFILLTSSFALADGSILGWGAQVVDSAKLGQKNNISISTGIYHSLALKSDGSIVGWGDNYYKY